LRGQCRWLAFSCRIPLLRNINYSPSPARSSSIPTRLWRHPVCQPIFARGGALRYDCANRRRTMSRDNTDYGCQAAASKACSIAAPYVRLQLRLGVFFRCGKERIQRTLSSEALPSKVTRGVQPQGTQRGPTPTPPEGELAFRGEPSLTGLRSGLRWPGDRRVRPLDPISSRPGVGIRHRYRCVGCHRAAG